MFFRREVRAFMWMNRRPLVAIACCWLFGVSAPSLFHAEAVRLTAVAGGVLLLAGLTLSKRINGPLAAVCAAALLLAAAERTAADRMNASGLAERWAVSGMPESAVLSGRVASPPDVDGDTAAFEFKADQLHVAGASSGHAAAEIRETVMVRVKLREQEEQAVAADWKRGDRLTIEGTPERPGEAGNFGVFDYRSYLERQGIHWQWMIEGTEGVRPEEAAIPWHIVPLRAIDELRSRIGRLMDRLYPHGDAGYMKGLTAGITEEIDPALYDAYSRLGLTHVLAISGLHVAVVVFVLLRLGALFRLTRERSMDLTMAAMPVYMLATGASPSAVRACLMAMIALALARRHMLKDGLHLLAAAAIAMTAWDPATVEDVSFQLSFAVTAGLLLFTSIMGNAMSWVRPKALKDALAVGMTAQAVSIPLTVYYFNGFHLLSLPANLVLVPFISFVILPLGMASAALGAFWLPLGVVPAAMASYGNRLTEGLVEWLNRSESLGLIWPQAGKLWVIAAYWLLGWTMAVLKRRNERRALDETMASGDDETMPLGSESAPPRQRHTMRLGPAALLLLWGGWWVWGYQPAVLDRSGYVQFLDVGQGDAALIRTGEGKHVLVDAGGTVRFRKPGEEWKERRDPYEIGRKLLVPLLKQRGVRALDALVLTHLDADHIGGAAAIVRSVPVRAIVWNGTWKKDSAVESLFKEAAARGIPIYAASSGMQWEIDDSAALSVLYPAPPEASPPDAGKSAFRLRESAEQNENSIVLLLKMYDRRFLLTGDVEARGETEILSSLSASAAAYAQPIDVMKAAHHGSKTSTSPLWLSWWRPLETVISVGRGNWYGHPHPSVAARLEEAGTRLFRTDRDGEVRYRVRPNGTLWRQFKRVSSERA